MNNPYCDINEIELAHNLQYQRLERKIIRSGRDADFVNAMQFVNKLIHSVHPYYVVKFQTNTFESKKIILVAL